MDFDHRIARFRDDLLRELTGNILPYWSEKMVDTENGGFYGRRDGHDHLIENADKGVILNARILWTFSAAARHLGDEKYLSLAHRGYRYFARHFIDEQHGGVFWMVDFAGRPVQTKKQIYAQAFAVYALTEYYFASADQMALSQAKKIYMLVEKHSFDLEHNGYLEAFDRQWNLLDDLRLSEKDANEKKSMNTHLHVLEAYTSLYRAWPDEKLRQRLRNLIGIFTQKILDHGCHFNLFFDEEWNVKSSEISYGHDIEGAWLLYEAAEVLGEEDLMGEVGRISLNIADTTLAEGIDSEGAVKNDSDDADRHWWPQAEAMVGFVNSWELTGQNAYLSAALRLWDFIGCFLIDKRHGEWFWRVDENGKVNFSEDKAGPWKCPYHNGRAIIELLRRLDE